MTLAHLITAALWCLVVVAVVLAGLVVVKILDRPKTRRELEHECWPDCTSPLHYTPHIPSPADAWDFR